MVRKKNDEKRPNDLTRLEEDVMATVWRLGECSSAEVIDAYNETNEPLAKTTIRTVLANLREKGYLEPVPTTERGFRLRATVSRNDFAARTLRQITRRLLDGSPRRAIACLINDHDIDEADLEAIQALIKERKKRGNQP